MRQIIIYCDESIKRGTYFSNFYGGALLEEKHRQAIEAELNQLKLGLKFGRELKWTKITDNYSTKYIHFIARFFKFIKDGKIKVRIMFTQNRIVPLGLSDEQLQNEYFLLYYQFLKHAFGLQYIDDQGLVVSTYLDQLPNNETPNNEFKDYISSLTSFPPFRAAAVSFPRDRIVDVDSKDHVILQALDIILGSIQFRLNDLHLAKPDNSKFRAKRTIAKEKVYRFISSKIKDLHPNFNIGVSTGRPNGHSDRWSQPYRHWLFVPSEAEIDHAIPTKNRKAPQPPT